MLDMLDFISFNNLLQVKTFVLLNQINEKICYRQTDG
jgi:hypothetical protein